MMITITIVVISGFQARAAGGGEGERRVAKPSGKPAVAAETCAVRGDGGGKKVILGAKGKLAIPLLSASSKLESILPLPGYQKCLP